MFYHYIKDYQCQDHGHCLHCHCEWCIGGSWVMTTGPQHVWQLSLSLIWVVMSIVLLFGCCGEMLISNCNTPATTIPLQLQWPLAMWQHEWWQCLYHHHHSIDHCHHNTEPPHRPLPLPLPHPTTWTTTMWLLFSKPALPLTALDSTGQHWPVIPEPQCWVYAHSLHNHSSKFSHLLPLHLSDLPLSLRWALLAYSLLTLFTDLP